jgi:gluconolactonase
MKALFVALALMMSASAFCQSPKRAPAPPPLPDTLTVERDVEYGQTAEQRLLMDVYRPKGARDKLPACVLVHGGGWTGGTKERFTALAIALAQRGYVVANIEYRLAGVAKYPAAVQDCNAAVRFVRANASRFDLDPARVGAWGGSAGAHLVGLVAAAPDFARFKAGDPAVSARVKAAVVMAGPMELNTPSFIQNLRQQEKNSNSYKWIGQLYDEAPDVYREASPRTYLDRHTAPILFLRGSLDQPEADITSWQQLQALGVSTERVILPDAKHGCWMQAPGEKLCVDAVDAFFRRHL